MIVLVWLHLLAAIIWIGGMVFLSAVLGPVLKREPFAGQRSALIRAVGQRLRFLVWVSILILLTTGIMLLSMRVPSLVGTVGWPAVARLKIVLVLVVILLTALHDFWLGPVIGRVKSQPPATLTRMEQAWISLAPWFPRVGLLLAIGIVFLGVALARS